MNKKCEGCGIKIQTTDENKIGYAQKKENKLCQRCYDIKNFNKAPNVKLDANEFDLILEEIGKSKEPVIWVLDVFNFDGSYLKEIQKKIVDNPVLIVVNKIDLLPKSTKLEKVKKWIFEEISEEIDLLGIEVISAKKKKNIDNLVSKLRKMKIKKIHVIGTTNTGKSTLINTVISSLDPHRKIEIITSQYAGTTLSSIKVNISKELTMFDTPGIENENQVSNFLGKDSIQKINPKNEIRPITYQLNSGQSLFITGLVQCDFVKGEKASFTVYASPMIKIHRTKMENAEKIRLEHLGKELLSPPDENEIKKIKKWETQEFEIKSDTDIVFNELGWIAVKGKDKNLIISITTPESLNIKVRKSLIGE